MNFQPLHLLIKKKYWWLCFAAFLLVLWLRWQRRGHVDVLTVAIVPPFWHCGPGEPHACCRTLSWLTAQHRHSLYMGLSRASQRRPARMIQTWGLIGFSSFQFQTWFKITHGLEAWLDFSFLFLVCKTFVFYVLPIKAIGAFLKLVYSGSHLFSLDTAVHRFSHHCNIRD